MVYYLYMIYFWGLEFIVHKKTMFIYIRKKVSCEWSLKNHSCK